MKTYIVDLSAIQIRRVRANVSVQAESSEQAALEAERRGVRDASVIWSDDDPSPYLDRDTVEAMNCREEETAVA